MKKSPFTESQIIAILKQHEAGISIPDLAREHRISSTSVYKWQAQYGDMDASIVILLKELEAKNRRFKKGTRRKA